MMGFVQAVAAVAAQRLGEDASGLDWRRRDEATNEHLRVTMRMGVWLGVAVSIPVVAICLHAETILLALGQKPALAAEAALYIYARLPAAPLLAAFMAMRMTASAMSRPGPALWIAGLMFVTNVFLNWVLIYGNLGAPALGVLGAAIASAIAEVVGASVLIAIFVFDRDFASLRPFKDFFVLHWDRMKELARLGWPIALSWSFEGGVFNLAVVMMGWISASALAGHQIAINVASFTFMVPMALSSAATVRVGYGAGAGDSHGVRRAGHVAIGMAAAFMLAMGAMMWTAPDLIAALYLDLGDPGNVEAVGYAASFLAIAALFQLFDGLQVAAAGSLRGLKDTRTPMVIAGLAYWGLAAPLSYALGFWAGWGGVGIWWGLAAGLAVAAVLMVWRFEAKAVRATRAA